MKITKFLCLIYLFSLAIYSEEVSLQLDPDQLYTQEIEVTEIRRDLFLNEVHSQTFGKFEFKPIKVKKNTLKLESKIEEFIWDFWIDGEHYKRIHAVKGMPASEVHQSLQKDFQKTFFLTVFRNDRSLEDNGREQHVRWNGRACLDSTFFTDDIVCDNVYKPLFLLKGQELQAGKSIKLAFYSLSTTYNFNFFDVVSEKFGLNEFMDRKEIQYVWTFQIQDVTDEAIQFELIKEAYLKQENGSLYPLPYSGSFLGRWNRHNAFLVDLEGVEESPFYKYQIKVNSQPN